MRTSSRKCISFVDNTTSMEVSSGIDLTFGKIFRIDLHQWIENNQVLNKHVRMMDTQISSILLDKVQLSN